MCSTPLHFYSIIINLLRFVQALIHGLNRHYYSIPIAYRTHDLEQKVSFVFSFSVGFSTLSECFCLQQMLLNLNKQSWMDSLAVQNYTSCSEKNKESMQAMLKLAKMYKKVRTSFIGVTRMCYANVASCRLWKMRKK